MIAKVTVRGGMKRAVLFIRGRHFQTVCTRHAPPARFRREDNTTIGENIMLSWTITFLVIAIIAAVLGFGGIAGTAVGIAKILFFIFLVLFVISLLMGRKSPPV